MNKTLEQDQKIWEAITRFVCGRDKGGLNYYKNDLIEGFKVTYQQSLPSKPVGDVECVCQECGGKNPTWYADNDLFNKVNGSPNGIICPSCFEQKANKMGIEVIFKSGYAAAPQKGMNLQPVRKFIQFVSDKEAHFVRSNIAEFWYIKGRSDTPTTEEFLKEFQLSCPDESPSPSEAGDAAPQKGMRWVKASDKRPSVEIITIQQLIEFGINNGANIVNGMPWSFSYKGHPITHENDKCYLVGTDGEKCTDTTPVLLFNNKIYPYWGGKLKLPSLYKGVLRGLIFTVGRWSHWSGWERGSHLIVAEEDWQFIQYLDESPSDSEAGDAPFCHWCGYRKKLKGDGTIEPLCTC